MLWVFLNVFWVVCCFVIVDEKKKIIGYCEFVIYFLYSFGVFIREYW